MLSFGIKNKNKKNGLFPKSILINQGRFKPAPVITDNNWKGHQLLRETPSSSRFSEITYSGQHYGHERGTWRVSLQNIGVLDAL